MMRCNNAFCTTQTPFDHLRVKKSLKQRTKVDILSIFKIRSTFQPLYVLLLVYAIALVVIRQHSFKTFNS